MALPDIDPLRRAWAPSEPDRLMGRGHPARDLLEAHEWRILFGGFTPTYVDLVALHTVRAGRRQQPGGWLSTTDMRVDYFAPVSDDRILIGSEVLNRSGCTHHVRTRFLDRDANLLALAMTTLIELRGDVRPGAWVSRHNERAVPSVY